MSNVETRSAIAVGFFFPAIDGILVVLRFYTRRKLQTKCQFHDWLCIPAWFCLTGCCATLLTGVFKDVFAEVDDSNDHVTEKGYILEQVAIAHEAQITAALFIFWVAANFLVKLIMLFFYRRIFVGRIFNICNWIMIVLSCIWFICALVSWLLCHGTGIQPNVAVSYQSCVIWGLKTVFTVFALDCFTDFSLLVLPIPFVWRLQLDLKRKIAITVVFILGGGAFVGGLCNTIVQLSYYIQFCISRGSLLVYKWPTIEIGLGLLASNLPHLSFRLARALVESLSQVLHLSFESLGSAVATCSRFLTQHPYGEAQPTDRGRRVRETESKQVLRPDVALQRWENTDRPSSLEQGSERSTDIIELPNLSRLK